MVQMTLKQAKEARSLAYNRWQWADQAARRKDTVPPEIQPMLPILRDKYKAEYEKLDAAAQEDSVMVEV